MFDIIKNKLISTLKSSDSLIEEGDHYFDSGDYGAAVDCYYKALEKDPNNDYGWYSLGKALYKLSRYKDALEAIDEALNIDKDKSEYYYLKGLILYELGKCDGEDYEVKGEYKKYLEQSYSNFKRAYELDKRNYNTMYMMGKILLYFEKYTDAKKFFEKCHRLNPEMGQDIVDSYKLLKRIMDSYDYIEKFLKLMELKKYGECIKNINKVLSINENDDLALYYKSCIYEILGDYNNALNEINKSLDVYPRSIYCAKLGDIIYKLKKLAKDGNYEQALAKYNESIDLDDTLPYGYFGLGITYYNLMEEIAALKYFDTILDMDMGYLYEDEQFLILTYTLIGKGDIEDNKRFFNEALNLINELLAKERDNVEYWKLKGYVLYRLERYSEAIEMYNYSLSISPNDTDALESIAILNIRVGNYIEAINIYEKLSTIDYKNSHKYELLIAEINKAREMGVKIDKELTSPLLGNICIYYSIRSLNIYILETIIKYITENPMVAYGLFYNLLESEPYFDTLSSNDPEFESVIKKLKNKLKTNMLLYMEYGHIGYNEEEIYSLIKSIITTLKEHE